MKDRCKFKLKIFLGATMTKIFYFTEERCETFLKFYKIMGKSEKSSVTNRILNWNGQKSECESKRPFHNSLLSQLFIFTVYILYHTDCLHQRNMIESTTDGWELLAETIKRTFLFGRGFNKYCILTLWSARKRL